MFDFSQFGSGGTLNPNLTFNFNNTVLLLFFLAIVIMFTVRYKPLRKWGLKLVFAIILIYGGYTVGLYIGVEILHSTEHWNLFAILGILAGLAAFLFSTKMVNEKFK